MEKTNKVNSKIYIAIPNSVYQNKDLNSTDKIILGWITGFENEWNTISTTTISNTMNLSISAVRDSIKKLVFLDLLKQKYYYARKRVFKSTISKKEKAVVLIPNEILQLTVSSTYKITMGFIIAASTGDENTLGGYNFNNVKRLEKLLGLSTSSVYRHIAFLRGLKYIDKDSTSPWLLRPQDSYFKKRMAKINRGIEREKRSKATTASDDDPNYTLDDYQSQALDNIYNGMSI